MKTVKAFMHVLGIIVGAALVIYGLNELGLINPIVEGVNFGIKKVKLLF
jgi:C4-dicarboxylate transporter